MSIELVRAGDGSWLLDLPERRLRGRFATLDDALAAVFAAPGKTGTGAKRGEIAAAPVRADAAADVGEADVSDGRSTATRVNER